MNISADPNVELASKIEQQEREIARLKNQLSSVTESNSIKLDYSNLNSLNIAKSIIGISTEINFLRRMIAKYQKSVSINLCFIEKNSDPNVEIGEMILKLKLPAGKHF